MIRSFRTHALIPFFIMLLAFKEGDGPDVVLLGRATFTNPLLESGPDPWVVQKDGWYYVTHTTGKDLRLYRVREMSDLSHAEMKTIWTPPSTGMNSKQIWAPEIHFLGGKWYCYYAADDGRNENHRMWVLENKSSDPFEGTWTDKGVLQLPDDEWAIDGTAFEHGGQLYFLWSGWQGDVNGRQDIYITSMLNPWTPAKERVLLSKPEYEWEMRGGNPAVNEAPEFLRHGDKVFIVYSASGCWTDDYALGLLSASANADLTLPSSWIKSPKPVFEKSTSSGAYGPGHNSFFKSPDGTEDWILYHANPGPGQGCGGKRSPRMQKFTWTTDGSPNFGIPVKAGVPLEAPSGERD
ncbi:MAG TPA: glycoside hydrolase family 43 protein [Chryseosolibacter sp.]